MDNRLKKTYENLKNYGRGRNYKVFAIFVFISAFFWFLIKFSIQYTVHSSFQVEYENTPKDLSWGEIEEHSIELSTTASGFEHLRHWIINKKVNLDLSKIRKGSGGIYYVLPKEQIGLIKAQFPVGVNVVYQNPDSLYFDFSKKVEKKIPVILDDSLSLAKSFKYKSPTKITPDSIVISGPKSKVSKISSIKSNRFVKTDINGNSITKVYLNKIEDDRIKISQAFVEVSIDVEKFTQNSMEVPVSITNVPDGYILKTFPDKVKIVFNTGLSDFPSISETTFRAIVNYTKADSLSNNIIPVIVEVKSNKVELIKVEPSDVEFLLREIGSN